MKWIIAFVSSLWVSVPAAVQALLVLMTIDYVTGLLRAVVRRDLCSATGLKGLVKKTLMMLLVVVAHFLVRTLHVGFDFGSTVATAFAVNEAISIVENCAEAGVPIPTALLEVLIRAKRITGRDRAPRDVKRDLEGRRARAANNSNS